MQSVYSLKPSFSDKEGYREWLRNWKLVYAHISAHIRRRKLDLKELQRKGDAAGHSALSKSLALQSTDARHLMTILQEARDHWSRIRSMQESIKEFRASLPLTVEARVVDFHFNKGHIQFPKILPRWMVKANGKTYYIEHMNAQMGFSTRELDEGSTLGMLRFRNVAMTIDEDCVAHLNPRG